MRRGTGEWGGVYESSVPMIGCGEGESGEKNSCGDSLPLVKRAADAKLGQSVLAKHRRASRSPFGKFFSFFPGQVIDGTEDSAKVIAPSAGFRG